MNPKTVLKYASDQGAKFVSVRFTDLPGSWQHLTFPIAELGEDSFEDGFGFDASSIRGWASIHESDMLLVPDPVRYWMDPFAEEPTICFVGTADNLQIFKYVVRNTAYQYGKAATFMPKPMYGDNGSGMHCHQSLWKGEKPLFAGDGYAGLSDIARWYIGGFLQHAAAVVAFAAPTTNSYKRLVPGFEAPVNLAYSARNRSAAIRIPMFSTSPKLKRLEFRPPDPSCNPYLAFSAMLMAGLDGVQNRIDPGEPLDKDIYDLAPEELKNVPSLPGSLDESLKALEADHDFLLKGEVFTPRLIERWISYKREREINVMRMRPHPLEFALYYDV